MDPLNEEQERFAGSLRAAIARRAAFAREQHPEGVGKPPLELLWAELRSLYRGGHKVRFTGQRVQPAVSPMPVMLLPGFGAHPKRMKPMADALSAAGHHVHQWGLGLNLGPNERNFSYLMRRVAIIARENWHPVVTGHSVDSPPIDCDFSEKPAVPTIALWSPRDGIIQPRAAAGWPHERDRAVAIRCSHLDFSSSPKVVAEVLRQLDVRE